MSDTKKESKANTGKRAVKSAVAKTTKAAPAKKAGAPKPAVKTNAKAAVASKPVKKRATKSVVIAPEQRRNYIEVAAYYIAARRDFAPGDPLQDWILAEAEIERLLKEGLLGLLPP